MTLTPDEVRRVAEAYVKEIIFTVDFHVGGLNLSDRDLDRILSTVHEQLVQAWSAGYAAGSGNDPEAA